MSTVTRFGKTRSAIERAMAEYRAQIEASGPPDLEELTIVVKFDRQGNPYGVRIQFSHACYLTPRPGGRGTI